MPVLCFADTTPTVTVRSSPNGFPIAITQSPTSISSELPSSEYGRFFSSIFNRVYETGRKVAEGFKESMRIIFDDNLAPWNYVAVPETNIL